MRIYLHCEINRHSLHLLYITKSHLIPVRELLTSAVNQNDRYCEFPLPSIPKSQLTQDVFFLLCSEMSIFLVTVFQSWKGFHKWKKCSA